jgi:hypothetical protein
MSVQAEGRVGKSKGQTVAAIAIAVAVVCLAFSSVGCSKKSSTPSGSDSSPSPPSSVIGSYTSIGYFFTQDSRRHQVVSRLWLEGNGAWTLNAPIFHQDGTTTPYYIHGTYAVDGDKLQLSVSEGLWTTGAISGRKLSFKNPELTFSKDSTPKPLPSSSS